MAIARQRLCNLLDLLSAQVPLATGGRIGNQDAMHPIILRRMFPVGGGNRRCPGPNSRASIFCALIFRLLIFRALILRALILRALAGRPKPLDAPQMR